MHLVSLRSSVLERSYFSSKPNWEIWRQRSRADESSTLLTVGSAQFVYWADTEAELNLYCKRCTVCGDLFLIRTGSAGRLLGDAHFGPQFVGGSNLELAITICIAHNSSHFKAYKFCSSKRSDSKKSKERISEENEARRG